MSFMHGRAAYRARLAGMPVLGLCLGLVFGTVPMWLFYVGKEICIASLIFGAKHSLAQQSEEAGYTPGCPEDRKRNHVVNVHGCGIGWYGKRDQGLIDDTGLSAYERPSVYTSVAAPTHDRNLRSLSKSVETSLLFGHVRGAGPGGAVHEYNCHPFSCGRYLFMHNGEVPNFCRIRRSLLGRLRDEIFEWISGTTDSELVFALFLNELPDTHTQQPAPVLQAAMKSTIALIVAVCKGEAASLNFAVSDGETVIATRFRNGKNEVAPSLYYHLGPMPGEKDWDLTSAGGMDQNIENGVMYEAVPTGCQPPVQFGTSPDDRGGGMHRCPSGFRSSRSLALAGRNTALDPRQSLLVASEPLQLGTGDSEWRPIPCNTMLTALCRWRDGPDAGKPASRADLLESPDADHAGAVVLDVTLDSLADLAGCCPVAVAQAVAASRSHIELASLRSSVDGGDGGCFSGGGHHRHSTNGATVSAMGAGLPPRCPSAEPSASPGRRASQPGPHTPPQSLSSSQPIAIPGAAAADKGKPSAPPADQAPAGAGSASSSACGSPRKREQMPGVAAVAASAAVAVL